MNLIEGDIFRTTEGECIVVMVNESRARCFPLKTKVESFIPQTGKNAGKLTTYHKHPDAFNISPNSEVDFLRRGGSKAVADFLSGITAANRKETTSSGEVKEETEMKKRTTKPIKNPRGGLAAEAKSNKTPKVRKESKCGYIDDLLETGKHTKSEILDLVCEKFKISKADRDSTMATINVRPSHMKKAGRKAEWKPEPETATA